MYACRASCSCANRTPKYFQSMTTPQDSEPLQPNRALRHLRETIGYTQESFANTLDFATAYVQAVELGQRPATDEFVNRVVMKTGVWPACIKDKWAEAVDFYGAPYTAKTFRRLNSGYHEVVNEKDIDALLAPAKRLLLAAAKASKTNMAAYFLRRGLVEATEKIFGVSSRIKMILQSEESRFGKLTVGDLRANPQLAATVGFKDDPRRAADELIVLQAEQDLNWSVAEFYPTGLAPDEQEMFRIYAERIKFREQMNAAKKSAPDVLQPLPAQAPSTGTSGTADPSSEPEKKIVAKAKRKGRRSSTDTSAKE